MTTTFDRLQALATENGRNRNSDAAAFYDLLADFSLTETAKQFTAEIEQVASGELTEDTISDELNSSLSDFYATTEG